MWVGISIVRSMASVPRQVTDVERMRRVTFGGVHRRRIQQIGAPTRIDEHIRLTMETIRRGGPVRGHPSVGAEENIRLRLQLIELKGS